MSLRPYYQDGSVTLYHGDCRDVLAEFVIASGVGVDHVITDPPYSEHVHSRSRRGGEGLSVDGSGRPASCSFSRVKEFGFEAMTDELRAFCGQVFGELAQRWTLVFSDVEMSHLWRRDIAADFVRTMFWRKLGGTPQFTGDRPAVACEAITACHAPGRKRWNGGGKHGFYEVPIVLNRGGNDPRLHTTQKPLELMQQLIADFTDPYEVILDPFAGSGTTGAAAKQLGRRAILVERDERYCEVAANRLRQSALDLWEPATNADAVDPQANSTGKRPTRASLFDEGAA